MLFSDEFLATLSRDPLTGIVNVCAIVRMTFDESAIWKEKDLQALTEGLALLEEMDNAELLPIQHYFNPLNPALSLDVKCSTANSQLQQILDKANTKIKETTLQKQQNRFKAALGKYFAYEFSQGDLERMQTLISELRTAISSTDKLETGHQSRLLKRLEALQAEMHKKISDLDKFWGLIGDAGVVLGKLGTDAKPFVDRVREITQITWQTQSRAEELPSGTRVPELGHKSDESTIDA